VIDRYGDIVARNRASDLLIEGAAPELLEPPLNALRLALHPNGLAPRIRNAGEWSQHVVRRLRLDSFRNPDPKLSRLLAELETYLPEAIRSRTPSWASRCRCGWRTARTSCGWSPRSPVSRPRLTSRWPN
jgi:hypothetical protein